jgi:RNA polymerase sigma-70 factor (ECF subfamily)
MEEHEAIRQLKRGDINGLEELVRRYQTEAVRIAYLICRDRSLAEDIMQAAFLRVFERINQYDGGRPFGPWFRRMVMNDAIRASQNHQRQVPLASALDEDKLVSTQSDPAEVVEVAERHKALHEMLDQLSPEQRAVIVERYYLEMTEAQMAEQAACSIGTIKSRLHYARQNLRRLLSRAISNQEPSTTISASKTKLTQNIQREAKLWTD